MAGAALRTSAKSRRSALDSRTPASNQTMQHLLRRRGIQAKLAVSTPDDHFELEANRVADQVMRMASAGAAARPNAGANIPSIQRMCDECEEELQRTEANNSAPLMTSTVESQIGSMRSGGKPLSPQTRSFFEPRFGRDFSAVRVHSDASAAATAESVNALAYTHGQHIVFGAGQYQPDTSGGQKLLAHELTHVVQQGATRSTPVVQRQSRLSDAPPGLSARCTLVADARPAAGGTSFLFGTDSTTFTPTTAERASLNTFVNNWHQAGSFQDILVQGFASETGDAGHNWSLSCSRAEALKSALVAAGIADARIRLQATGPSNKATSTLGNQRAVISVIPGVLIRPSRVTPRGTGASCPQSVSIVVSRGNDDQAECQYQDAIITATIELDSCACAGGAGIPVTIRFNAVLDGKSFANAAGTIRETQASTVGRTFFLQEEGTTNRSPALVHSGDIGRPGDPDDTLNTQLRLLARLGCEGESRLGRVLVTNGSFVQQVIRWAVTADRTGVQLADISLEQRQVPGRVLPPLRNIGSPYPAFPGVPRDNRCSCHPVTGLHQGSACPPRFLTGSSVGGP